MCALALSLKSRIKKQKINKHELIVPVLEIHINEVIQKTFSGLFSFNIIPVRAIHVAAWPGVCSFLWLNNVSLYERRTIYLPT